MSLSKKTEPRTIAFISFYTTDGGAAIMQHFRGFNKEMISADFAKDHRKVSIIKKTIEAYITKLGVDALEYGCDYEETIKFFKNYSNEHFIQARNKFIQENNIK